MGFLSRLFGGGSKPLWITDYAPAGTLKLKEKVKTPMGGTASVVTVFLDIAFVVKGDMIEVEKIRLGRGASHGRQRINMASKAGEAWYSLSLPAHAADVRALVMKDLNKSGSRLRKMMLRQWQETRG